MLVRVSLLMMILASAAHAAPIDVRGIDPRRGACDGTFDAAARPDGKLQVDLRLRFRSGGTVTLRGPLEPVPGKRTRWKAQVVQPAGLSGLGGGAPQTGTVEVDYDAQGEWVDGTYVIPGSQWVRFGHTHDRLPVTDQRHVPALAPGDPRFDATVQVHYFGAAGYHVKRGRDEVLFAPFFSSPSFADVAASEVTRRCRADARRIDEGLLGVSLAGVQALLVGHGHYDHLMDVPEVARRHAPSARLFMNRTSRNIVAGETDGAALVARTDVLEDWCGRWWQVPGAKVRVMPIEGDHADHLWPGIRFYTGEVTQPRTTPAGRGSEWREGRTFVFLVDFLDDQGAPVYRIYYQDAGMPPDRGVVPVHVLAERRVDLAIYCISVHEHVHDFPGELTRRLDPRVIVLGHWEDIVRPLPGIGATRAVPLAQLDLRLVHATNPRTFVRELDEVRAPDSRWLMPLPGSRYLLQ